MMAKLKKAAWIIGSVVGTLGAVLIVLLVFANTGPGRRTIEWLLPRLTDGQVTAQGISGRVPDSLGVAHLQLHDAKGVWLTADDAAIDWSPIDVIWNKVKVETIAAKRIDVLRRPVQQQTAQNSDLHIQIDALQFDRVDVAPAVAWRKASVTLSGKVDYVSLDDARIDIAARRLDAPGAYRIDANITRSGISGMVDVREPAGGLIGGLVDLPTLGPLSLEASATGPRNAQQLVVTLAAGPLRANAHGVIDLMGRTAQIDLAANAPAMTPGPTVSWASVVLVGHLQGAFARPDVDAHLRIEQLKAQGGSAQTVKADIAGRGGSAGILAQVVDLKWQGLPADFFQGAPLTLRANILLDAPSRLISFELSHRLALIRGNAALGDEVKANATLTLHSLAPFATLAGVDLRGSATATASLGVQDGKTGITLGGTIDATGGEAVLKGLIGPNAKFAFTGSFEKQSVTVDQASLDGAALQASATGSLRDKTIGLDWTAGLRDLSSVARSLSGSIALRGHIKGTLDNFGITAKADGQMASGKFAKGPIQIAARIDGLPNAAIGKISVDGRLNASALQALVSLEHRKDGALRITVTKGDWKSLRARADLTLPRNSTMPAGKIVLHAGQLADLRPFLNSDIAGKLDASASLVQGKTSSQARLNIVAKDIAVQGIHLENLMIEGLVSDPMGDPKADLKLAATGIAAKGLTGNLQAQIAGPYRGLAAKLSLDLRDQDGNPAHAHSAAIIDADKSQIVWTAFDAQYRGQTAHLLAPVKVDLANGIGIDRLKATAGEAQIELSGRVTPTLDATISLRNVTSALIKPFVHGLEADGILSADAKLSGTLSAPQGTVSIHGTGLRIQSSGPGVAPGELVANATLRGQTALLEAHLMAGKSLSLSVSGDVPLEQDGTINLRVKGTTDLALLNPILNAEGRNLRGRTSVDAMVAGTELLPRVTGTATLSGGDFQDYVQGIHIADLSGDISAQGDKITITQLKGRAGHGTISADGDIDLWAPGMPVKLSITATNARLLASALMTIDANATLKLTGQAQSHVNLIGNIQIGSGEVNLPETMPRTVAVLDVRRPGQAFLPPPPSAAPLIGLDVTVNSSGRLFVRGRGLDAEVGGKLHVEGSNIRPNVIGGFDMRRGELSVAGQTLSFTSGRLGFDGAGLGGSLDPSLNFVAQSTSGSVTAKLEVTGYASAPKIKLSSTPYLPQDEVLAHLLFQQSIKQLGPLQLAQIAEALGSLAGIGSGLSNPLSSVRKGLGLDRLSVGGGENGTGASVEAGKYVTNGVYVGAKQDTGGGTTAQVQVDLTEHLKLQTTVNTDTSANVIGSSAQTDRGSSVGLSYQFEY